MKTQFTIGAKLLGIYLFYLSLLNFFQAIAALFVFSSSSSEPFSMLTLVSSTGSLIIILVFSILLLFKTEKLSFILQVNDEIPESNSKISIRSGIILIGIYIFSTRIGSFLSNLYIQIKEANAGRELVGTFPDGPTLSKDMFTISITIIFSICLIFGSKMIEKIVFKFS